MVKRLHRPLFVGDDEMETGCAEGEPCCPFCSRTGESSVFRMADSLNVKLFKSPILMRAPIWFYRAGLGFLFGKRLIMLEHVGRSSGAARYAVLEVVSRPDPTTVIVASALGRQAQWFQNLVGEPQCHVSMGSRRRAPAVATVLERDEADRFLTEYQSKHPALWKKLNNVITALHEGDLEFELPLVRLDLSPRPARRSGRREQN